MNNATTQILVKLVRLGVATLGGLLVLAAALLVLHNHSTTVRADEGTTVTHQVIPPGVVRAQDEITVAHAIPPEEGGYPKFKLSTKTVTPTLASTEGVTLYYTINIRNTGAYTASNVTLTDVIPDNTSYNGDAKASVVTQPTVTDGTLTWNGVVGFNSSVVISFSVKVSQDFSGIISNTAVISDPLITDPVTVTAETIVTDYPLLLIGKTAAPAKPGANKTLTYTLVITNIGQPPTSPLPITVTDRVPLSTTLGDIGPDGSSPSGDVVTWTRSVNLGTGETTVFTFNVTVHNVDPGTVITNSEYQVTWPISDDVATATGEVYTVTVVEPSFKLFKEVWPDPPGSNREMTYTLTVLNLGSLATDLVITDVVPAGVIYKRGGTLVGGDVVSWTWPSLATGETAEFTFTVDITDVAEVDIVNNDYAVCSAEGVCLSGKVLTNTVKGPTFEAFAYLDPIAKKPGGGGGPVTPTLVVRNLGPGNALDATALIQFERISIKNVSDLEIIPAGKGTLSDGPDCGDKCAAYIWVGDLAYTEVVTFLPVLKQGSRGRSTIGGEEGTNYTATVVITDSLSNMTTEPVTGTANGQVTHLANLIPTKSALPVVGPAQLLTYTISVWNSALSTDEPPPPWLTDTIPLSTTFVRASDGGVSRTVSNTTVVSWILPAMSPGDRLTRAFTVLVDPDLVSGTKIVNDDYRASWYEVEDSAVFSNTGPPVTTTVKEVGLIASYKEVTPTVALWGDVLTYYLYIANSSGVDLFGVTVEDLLPWERSTYQLDAITSTGTITDEDIVSVHWKGNVAAFSSEIITLSVVVDKDFLEGPITNTMIISHSSLFREIERKAVAYISQGPVLQISKLAPAEVDPDTTLHYRIDVTNVGRDATFLVISDVIPAGTTYITDSVSTGGQKVGNEVQWEIPTLESGESRTFEFDVKVGSSQIINDKYAVRSEEGAVGTGDPVVTNIKGAKVGDVYLPIILKKS